MLSLDTPIGEDGATWISRQADEHALDTVAELDEAEVHSKVAGVLATLPAEQRTVLQQRAAGRTFSEISRALHVPTVRVRVLADQAASNARRLLAAGRGLSVRRCRYGPPARPGACLRRVAGAGRLSVALPTSRAGKTAS